MWFKYTYNTGMYGRRLDEEPLQFESHIKSVGLTMFMLPGNPEFWIDVIAQRNVKPDVASMFNDLANHKMPHFSELKDIIDLVDKKSMQIDDEGKFPQNIVPRNDLMPQKMKEFVLTFSREMGEYANEFVKTLRWVHASTSVYETVGFSKAQWSQDGIQWHPLPSTGIARLLEHRPIDNAHGTMDLFRQVFETKNRESLAHALLREAVGISSHNRRSALLIGFTALETGLKELVSHLVPKANIILEKMQSPPVTTMMFEIIPNLLSHSDLSGYFPPKEKAGNEYIKKWMSQRNEVAHGRKKSVDYEDLSEFLRHVRSILYTVDYYKGCDWAKDYVVGGKWLQ